MTEDKAEQFISSVDRVGEALDAALGGEDSLVCMAALTRIIGTGLAIDIVGHVPKIDTLDQAMDIVNTSIRIAYEDAVRYLNENKTQ